MQPDRESGRSRTGTPGDIDRRHPVVAPGNRKGKTAPGVGRPIPARLSIGFTERSRKTARGAGSGPVTIGGQKPKAAGNCGLRINPP